MQGARGDAVSLYCKCLATKNVPRFRPILRGLRKGFFLTFSIFSFLCRIAQSLLCLNIAFFPRCHAIRPFFKNKTRVYQAVKNRKANISASLSSILRRTGRPAIEPTSAPHFHDTILSSWSPYCM